MNPVIMQLSNLNLEVTELKHAYRINGVVDVFRNLKTIYCIPENKYFTIEDNEIVEFVISKTNAHEKREPFKKTDNGGMTYQQFKNEIHKSRFKENAGDYHWKMNFDKRSDDHLYFLICGSRVKIGRSKDPKIRINTLKTGLSEGGFCYVFKNKGLLEYTLHKAFSKHHKSREWFDYHSDIKQFIQRVYTKENAYSLRF